MTLDPIWRKAAESHTSGCLEARWAKASASGYQGCLEARWVKSSSSGAYDCVQARHDGGRIQVRDSKDPDGPVLTFTPHEWACFLADVRGRDTFDLPAEAVPA